MARTSSLPLSVVLSLLLALLLVVFVPAPVHGVNDGLTEEEVELVAKFRVIVKDLIYKDWMNTDEYLVRWLRVRDHSLRAARDALQEGLEWRKTNGIDRILEEDFTDLEKELTVVFEGVDKMGRPLAMFNIGAVDIRKVVISGNGKRLGRFFTQLLELTDGYLRDLNEAEGNSNRTRALFILDVSGFNLRQHACPQCVPILISLFRLYESYFPDLAYKLYALNTPRAFMPFYELVRPFFSEPTRRALQLFDSNADRWKEALLKDVDPDQLPTVYGGTRIVHSKTISNLKKTNPKIKAVYDRARTAKQQIKTNKPELGLE